MTKDSGLKHPKTLLTKNGHGVTLPTKKTNEGQRGSAPK